MITIKCDKCDANDSNKYVFDDARFSYQDTNNYLRGCHLCKNCQRDLQAIIHGAIAEFLGEPIVKDWTKYKGIII